MVLIREAEETVLRLFSQNRMPVWVPKTRAAWADGGSARCAVPGGQVLVRPQAG
jgi:hypothetical protein